MTKYPDNVIPFPGVPRPISAAEAAHRDIPEDIHRILTEEQEPFDPSDASFRYLSLREAEELDFPLLSRPEIMEEGESIEYLLTMLASDIGDLPAKSLGVEVGKFVAAVADTAYSEGLAEAIIPAPSKLGYLSFSEEEKVTFPLMNRVDLHEEMGSVDHFLNMLSHDIGDMPAKSLGAEIGKFATLVADSAYAEGLAEALNED